MKRFRRMFDNTRVSTHKQCNRKYYFRHVMDWAGEGVAPELVFGGAWHSAMDILWRRATEESPDPGEIVKEAYEAFLAKWVEEGMKLPEDMEPHEYDSLKMRTPSTASNMLMEYTATRARYIRRGEVLEIERPFVVPLDPDNDPDLFYCGRLDKVFEDEEGISIIEHKTTGSYRKEGTFRSSFTESFSPNSQIDGYAYAASLLYGKKFKRVMIDAALVHKTIHNGFSLIPVQRDEAQLDAWRWETLEEVRRIEESMERLKDQSCTTLPYLPAFPKNTGSCQLYNRPCQYMDLCKSWSNPHGRRIPDGFIKEHWSPFDYIKLEELGFTKEEVGE